MIIRIEDEHISGMREMWDIVIPLHTHNQCDVSNWLDTEDRQPVKHPYEGAPWYARHARQFR